MASPIVLLAAFVGLAQVPVVERITPFTTQRLQAVSVAGSATVWVSGTGGTWGVTTDGGKTWTRGVVPGADSLEFRDVQAVDANRAYLLAAGPGDRSRIYKTTDRGATWVLQFRNAVADAFYDCFAFWDSTSGFVLSDAVGGVLPVLRTSDGTHWELSPKPPAALKGEGAFAASGTCVATWSNGMGWIATGAGDSARLLTTRDGGVTWTAVRTPMVQGSPSSGHTSVAFWDPEWGVAAGGDIGDTASTDPRRVIVTRDGGASWDPLGNVTFRGPVYGVAIQSGPPHGFPVSYQSVAGVIVAVGPRGASWSANRGKDWSSLDSLGYWSVAFGNGEAWMVGPAGRITKVSKLTTRAVTPP